MGQIKTRCSTAAGLFLILLTVIAGFSSCKSNQKDIIPSAEYAPYVNAYTPAAFMRQGVTKNLF